MAKKIREIGIGTLKETSYLNYLNETDKLWDFLLSYFNKRVNEVEYEDYKNKKELYNGQLEYLLKKIKWNKEDLKKLYSDYSFYVKSNGFEPEEYEIGVKRVLLYVYSLALSVLYHS